MIKRLSGKYSEEIKALIRKDSCRNYFIRLTLEKGFIGFDQVFGQYEGDILTAVIFKRHSGNLQIYAVDGFDANEISLKLQAIQFDKLISAASFCDQLDPHLFEKVEHGAYLVELKHMALLKKGYGGVDAEGIELEPLIIKDLEEVSGIYKKVFSNYSSIQVMTQKLQSGRGRGYVLKVDGRIVSVAQSEFEEEKSALVVGVATDPKYQKRGYGSFVLGHLCNKLTHEGKGVFLQFDNPKAGQMYGAMGFEKIDQIKHYYKKH